MKQFLIVLAILIIVQISSIKSNPLSGNVSVTNDPSVFYNATKQLSEKFNPLIKAVIADLPSTEEYVKHRKALENYFAKSEETKAVKEICFIKVFKMLEDFIDVLTPYKTDASAESRKVWELFNAHGYANVEKDLQTILVGYDVVEFGKRVGNLNTADNHEFLDLC